MEDGRDTSTCRVLRVNNDIRTHIVRRVESVISKRGETQTQSSRPEIHEHRYARDLPCDRIFVCPVRVLDLVAGEQHLPLSEKALPAFSLKTIRII